MRIRRLRTLGKKCSSAVTLVLASWLVALCSTNVKSDEPGHDVQLLAPKEIAGLRFGDPVLVPIAVTNFGEFSVCAPRLSGTRPPLSIVVKTDKGKIEIESGGDLAGGETRILGPGETESTVILINLWSPDLFRGTQDFKSPNRFTVHLSFLSEHCHVANAESPALDHQILIMTNDSVFSTSGDLRKTIPSIRDFGGQVFFTSNVMLQGHGSPFWPGATPLSWLDFKMKDFESWFDPRASFVQRSREYLKADSRAYRTLQASLLLAAIKRSGPLEANPETNPLVSDFVDLITRADPVEQIFFAYLTKNIPRIEVEPVGQAVWTPIQIRHLQLKLASELPHLAPQLFSAGFSVLSRREQ